MASLFESSLSTTSTNTEPITEVADRDDVSLPSDQGFVQNLLECPVCSEYMTGRVRLCVMGHSMCDSCFVNLLHSERPCPLCRKPLHSISARNFFLENLAALCKFKCKFAERGCEQDVEGFMLDIHIKQCQFRDFKCEMFGIREICSEDQLRYKDFLDHLRYDHEIPVVESGSWIEKSFCLEDGIISPSLVLVKFEDIIFFFHTIPLHNKYMYIQSSHEHMHMRWVLQLDGEQQSEFLMDAENIVDKFKFEIVTEYTSGEREESVEIPEVFQRNSVMRGILANALSFTQEYQPLDLKICRGSPLQLSRFPRNEHKFTKEDENSLFGLSLRNGATKMRWQEKVIITKTLQ